MPLKAFPQYPWERIPSRKAFETGLAGLAGTPKFIRRLFIKKGTWALSEKTTPKGRYLAQFDILDTAVYLAWLY